MIALALEATSVAHGNHDAVVVVGLAGLFATITLQAVLGSSGSVSAEDSRGAA